MKVTLATFEHFPAAGGTFTSVENFRRALGAGVVSFSTASQIPGPPADGSLLHVPVQDSPLGRAYAYSSAPQLREAEQMICRSDLVSCHILLRHHIQWAARICRRHRVPYWVVPHGTLDPYVHGRRRWIKGPWMRWVGRSILENAAAVIFATERERQKAEPYVPSGRARVVRWPAALPDLSRRAEARESLGRRLGIPSADRLLLWLGRLHPTKRPIETLAAFREAGLNGVHLLMAGPDQVYTRAEMQGRGLQVHVCGPLYGREKEEALLAADGFLSLSAKENFGHTVAEALAAGLPLILSPNIDLAPEVEPEGCGWFLRSLDHAEAVAALREFADAPAERLREMGARGRRWAEKELAFDLFAARLKALARESLT